MRKFKGRVSKRCMAAIMSAAMMMSSGAVALAAPLSAYAATYYLENGSITVSAEDSGQYVTQAANGIDRQLDETPVISTDDPDNDTLSAGESTTNTLTISAEAGQTAEVTLSDVNIDVSATDDAVAIEVSGDGAVNIELDGDNKIKSGSYCAGLQDDLAEELTINDDNDTPPGSLEATGNDRGAGIGGGERGAGENITINGGVITATAGFGGAGIGGGYEGTGKNITIKGGTVTATGGYSGAGIGGGRGNGNGGAGENIIINGGIITAKGGDHGAGIGGGQNGGANNITITEGTVVAIGGQGAAGIGTGVINSSADRRLPSGIVIEDDAIVHARGGAGHRWEPVNNSYNYEPGPAVGLAGRNTDDNTYPIPESDQPVNYYNDTNPQPANVHLYTYDQDMTAAFNYVATLTQDAADEREQAWADAQAAAEQRAREEAARKAAEEAAARKAAEEARRKAEEEARRKASESKENKQSEQSESETNNSVSPAVILPFELWTDTQSAEESDDAPVSGGFTLLTDTNDMLNATLNRVYSLLSSGNVNALNELKAKGVIIDTGNWISFKADTYKIIDQLVKAGIPVTIRFFDSGHFYTVTIPANPVISPLSLVNEEGYCGFLNLYANYGGIVL